MFNTNTQGAFKVSTELFGWKNKRTGEVIQHRYNDVESISLINTGAGRITCNIPGSIDRLSAGCAVVSYTNKLPL